MAFVSPVGGRAQFCVPGSRGLFVCVVRVLGGVTEGLCPRCAAVRGSMAGDHHVVLKLKLTMHEDHGLESSLLGRLGRLDRGIAPYSAGVVCGEGHEGMDMRRSLCPFCTVVDGLRSEV